MAATSIRLSRQDRHEQLLETALAMVRAQGADELTLVTLAEAAGVSRPVVYDHFGTRPGLLLSLYRRLEERHRAATEEALRNARPAVADLAQVTSAAYLACATDMPEFAAISAALKGDPEMERVQREMDDGYTDLLVEAFRSYTRLTPAMLRLRCVGFFGAAEAIAAELNLGRVTVEEATSALTELITRSLQVGEKS